MTTLAQYTHSTVSKDYLISSKRRPGLKFSDSYLLLISPVIISSYSVWQIPAQFAMKQSCMSHLPFYRGLTKHVARYMDGFFPGLRLSRRAKHTGIGQAHCMNLTPQSRPLEAEEEHATVSLPPSISHPECLYCSICIDAPITCLKNWPNVEGSLFDNVDRF
jgi:hypothetical protein